MKLNPKYLEAFKIASIYSPLFDNKIILVSVKLLFPTSG